MLRRALAMATMVDIMQWEILPLAGRVGVGGEQILCVVNFVVAKLPLLGGLMFGRLHWEYDQLVVGHGALFWNVAGRLDYRTCMASLVKYKSFCEVPKYVINARSYCPKLMQFTCYTHAQSCKIESCVATIAIQLPKVDKNIVITVE